jgi:hypothetical protein
MIFLVFSETYRKTPVFDLPADGESIERPAHPNEFRGRESASANGRGVDVADPREIKMSETELLWWTRVRRRGAMWFVVNKGLAFLLLYPAIGCFAIGWDWQPRLMIEGWSLGLVCGSFVWMRKELRFRFTLDDEGQTVPDARDD